MIPANLKKKNTVINIYPFLGPIKIFACIVCCLAVISISGCSNDAEIRESTRVLHNTSNLVSSAEEIDSGTMAFTVSEGDDIQEVEPGDYIVSGSTVETPNGFLKKVRAIQIKNGLAILNVEDAQLTDIIKNGSASINSTIDLKRDTSQVRQSTGGIHSSISQLGIILYGDKRPSSEIPVCSDKEFYVDFNNVDIEGKATLSGCVGFNSEFVFEMEIENFETTYTKFSLTSEAGCQIDLDVHGKDIDFSEQVELTRFDLAPITFTIGAVPVVIVPEIRMVLGLDGKLDLNVHTKMISKTTSTIGIKYENRLWSEINDRTHSFDYDFPTLGGSIDARVYTGPEMDFMFYGIAGPGANVYLFSRVKSDFDSINTDNSTWELWAGFQAGARFTVEALDTILFRVSEPNLIGYEGLIGSSEYEGLPEPGTGRFIGTIGDAVNGKIVTGDEIVANNLSGILVDLARGITDNANKSEGISIEEANEVPVWRNIKIGGNCLEPDFDGNLAIVRPAACNNSDTQKWWADGRGFIHSKLNHKRCIDGLGVTDGVNVVLYDCNGTASQKWNFTDKRIESTINNKYITYGTDAFGWIKYARIRGYINSENQIAELGTPDETGVQP